MCERPGGYSLHPRATDPDGRVRLRRTLIRSNQGSTAVWGFGISMVEEIPKTQRVVASMLIRKSEKCEKSEKSDLLLFQLEPAGVQFVANKIGGWRFSDFPKNFRGCIGGVCSKTVVQLFESGFCHRYRSVTVGNGSVSRSVCHAFALGLIHGQKIKVAQGGSRQIKVAQGIFKHFFLAPELFWQWRLGAMVFGFVKVPPHRRGYASEFSTTGISRIGCCQCGGLCIL